MTFRLSQPGPDDPADGLRAHADGVVCFGGVDWWYHNRGHYDLQMMRELSASVPILYVNSIGMRTPDPREGRQFLRRASRKLASLGRGLRRADTDFWVLTPPTLPGPAGARRTRPLLVRSVRAGMRRAGITRPIAWIACPPAVRALGPLSPAAVVYQRTDRYEHYTGVDGDAVRALDARLKARADLTVFCASSLFEQERDACRGACLVEHGVDAPFFEATSTDEPADLRAIPGPRVGFVGGIDAHTFDPDLFNAVARRLDGVSFVLVGSSSLPRGWCDLPNVHHIGRRPFAEVPRYLAACDVLIMPWNRSPWIDGCNPVKLREYLASGRPIVSTDFPELRRYRDLVNTATDAEQFAAGILRAIEHPGNADARRDRVREATWADRANAVVRALTARTTPTATAPPPPAARPLTTTPRAALPSPPLRLVGGARRSAPALDIAAFIILAGGLRPSPLVAAARRSALDLWLTPETTVLDEWLARWDDLGAPPAARIRVIHDCNIPPPSPRRVRPSVTIERELRPMRGTAGLLHDACSEYAKQRHVVVGQGAHYLDGDLHPLIDAHARRGSAITVATNPDGSPAGLYVVRCDVLRLVARIGFIDLKEQWLPSVIDDGHAVDVHRLAATGTMPLRTRRQFFDAARVANGEGAARVICPGALIAPGAVVTDSIVMPGAMVQRDAVVTRSILCPDARVSPSDIVTDTVLRATGAAYREDSAPRPASA